MKHFTENRYSRSRIENHYSTEYESITHRIKVYFRANTAWLAMNSKLELEPQQNVVYRCIVIIQSMTKQHQVNDITDEQVIQYFTTASSASKQTIYRLTIVTVMYRRKDQIVLNTIRDMKLTQILLTICCSKCF